MTLHPSKLLPFEKEGDGLLPWVIGVMMFLCMLFLAFSTTLSKGLENWSQSLSTTLTVQILDVNEDNRKNQVTSALRLIRATPGVKKADVLANSEVLSLLKPWLGDIPLGSGLPIPTLIDVSLSDTRNFNTDSLRERLLKEAPSAKLDDHQAWLGHIINLASLIKVLLIATTAMIILCTVAIVIFGCRTGLASHKEYIAVMHLIGAEDHMIAKAFDRRYLLHGLIGGLGGAGAASIVLIALNYVTEDIGQGLITAIVPTTNVAFGLLLLPVFASGLAMITARITVMRALSKMI